MSQFNRMENFLAALDRWCIKPSTDRTGNADLLDYLYDDDGSAPDEKLPRWAAITEHDDIVYVTPTDTKAGAIRYMEDNAIDDIYAETPIGLLDLDNGTWARVRVKVSINSEYDVRKVNE